MHVPEHRATLVNFVNHPVSPGSKHVADGYPEANVVGRDEGEVAVRPALAVTDSRRLGDGDRDGAGGADDILHGGVGIPTR